MSQLKRFAFTAASLFLLEIWAACTTTSYRRVTRMDNNNTYAVEMQQVGGCSNNAYLAKCQLNGNTMVCQPGKPQEIGTFTDKGFGPEE